MITATKPTIREDIPYPTVNQVETQIHQSQQKLTLILIQEKNLGATRQALLKLPETEENNKRLNKLKIEIVSTVSQKNLTEERRHRLQTRGTDRLSRFREERATRVHVIPQVNERADPEELWNHKANQEADR